MKHAVSVNRHTEFVRAVWKNPAGLLSATIAAREKYPARRPCCAASSPATSATARRGHGKLQHLLSGFLPDHHVKLGRDKL
jgi:hypothetical protein